MNNYVAETLTGNATNHLPFILAAYAVGAVLIFGYSIWLYLDRQRINSYLATLEGQNTSQGAS